MNVKLPFVDKTDFYLGVSFSIKINMIEEEKKNKAMPVNQVFT